MILLPKLRLGVTAFSGPESVEAISKMGVRHVNIPSSLLNADNAGAYMENAKKFNITIEAVCTGGSDNFAELAAAVGAKALCIALDDISLIGAVSDSAKSTGLNYLIWEPAGIGMEDCKRTLTDISKTSAIPVKLALSLESDNIYEMSRIIGKDAMIIIRRKEDIAILGKVIDSLRTGGSRENMIMLDMPSAAIDSLETSVDYCRSFVRE